MLDSSLRVSFLAGTLGQGGAERQLYYMLRALKGCGVRVRLLTLTSGEHWEGAIRELGVPVVWVGERRGKHRRLLRTIRALKSDPPDLLQSAHFYTNLYAVGAARWVGCREIGAIRSDVYFEVKSNGLFGRPSLRLPRLLAANSRPGLENAARCGVPRSRLCLLGNVVDLDRFRPSLRRVGGPFRLLLVGRLVPQKRIDRFLAAFARFRELSGREARATIVGGGPERGALEAEAARLGLGPDRVEFRGAVSDLAPIYREADLLVLTSDHEGTPNVVLEAMASGLPVVATRVGGTVDLVGEGETGFLFEPSESDAMASRIAELADDATLRLDAGRRARARVERDHSLSRLPGQLEDLYRTALR